MTDIFDAFRAKQREIFSKLKPCPSVTITGIVTEDGFYALQPTINDPITLRGAFEVWRVESEPIQTIQGLGIVSHVRRDEVERLKAAMPPNAIVRIRARFGANDSTSSLALFENLISTNVSDDLEMQQQLERLLTPDTITDSFFGTFTRHRRLCKYTAGVSWCNSRLNLDLLPDEPFDMNAAIATARTLWEDVFAWDRRVRDYAIDKLLHLKNSSWSDEQEMSSSEFDNRLHLDAISVTQSGVFTFHFECGDLFGDHGVEVYGNLKEGPLTADISG